MKTSWKERNVKLWEKIVCTYSMWIGKNYFKISYVNFEKFCVNFNKKNIKYIYS